MSAGKCKTYIVKDFDTEVLSFELVRGEFTDSFHVLDVFDEPLLPEYFRSNGLNDDSLERWLSMRFQYPFGINLHGSPGDFNIPSG